MRVNFVGMSSIVFKNHPEHKHLEWEMVCYITGEGNVTINGVQYPFSPGTIVCQPPGVLHSESSKNGFQNYFITIDDFVPLMGKDVVVMQDDEMRSFKTLMSLCFQLFYRRERGWEDIIQAIWESMYLFMKNRIDAPCFDFDIEAFRNLLVRNITNPDFSIATAIDKTGYCSDHFRRKFKKAMNMSPNEYLTQLRIEYAQKLLAERNVTGHTIKVISALSGFSDPYYFSRVFKKTTGQSPNFKY